MNNVIKVVSDLIFVRKPVNLKEVKEQTERVLQSFGQYYYKNEWKVVLEVVLSKDKYAQLTNNLLNYNAIFKNVNLGANEVMWVHSKTNKGILVDTQGYDYARYVALYK